MKCRISMSSLGIIAFVLFFSASCIPEFKNPLPVPKGVKPDQKILGTWETEGIGEKFQVSFFPPAKTGHKYIVWINIEGPEYEPDISIWGGYTTILNKDKFLCFRLIRKDSQDLGSALEPVFFIAHYRISDEDTLLIYIFSPDAIKRMIEKGKLKGEIEERSYSDKVTVTSSSEELAAAIIKEGVENFISNDEGEYEGMKFKRLKK
jgi:hypothetical protein